MIDAYKITVEVEPPPPPDPFERVATGLRDVIAFAPQVGGDLYLRALDMLEAVEERRHRWRAA